MIAPSFLRHGFAVLALLLNVLPVQAEPTVTNVRASQRPGTKLVDIYYDVTGTTSPVSVALQISENGGSGFSVPATALTGDTGFLVSPGRGKRIVWNAASDWNLRVTDTMKFRVSAIGAKVAIPLVVSNWKYFHGYYQQPAYEYPPAPGVFESTPEGLRFWDEGYRGGARIESKTEYYLPNATVYVKWRVNGGGSWGYFTINFWGLTGFNDLNWLSTNHSYAGSTVIGSDTWYYTRVAFDAELNFTSRTSAGNYDDKGGTIIQTRTGSCAKTGVVQTKMVIEFADTYAPMVRTDIGEICIQ